MRNGKRIHEVKIERLHDNDPDTSYLEQKGFEVRLDQYKRDVFSFIGIRATCQISVSRNEKPDSGYLLQTVSSGGLWGIEDDSDASYLKDVELEELNELRSQLIGLGFSKRAISAAFREVSNG